MLHDRHPEWIRAVQTTDGGRAVTIVEMRGQGSTSAPARARYGHRVTLRDARIAARISVRDLAAARAWYSEKLGLEPAEERPGGLRYEFSNGDFALFESDGAASGDHTQMAWDVDDFEATVEELKARGVSFEEYGTTVVEGNYPSKGGRGERATWFRDLDGNLFGLGQTIRD
jgi:catechol 2,3-dioxygenase-like lactoylglutathione lyase family enzyme